MLAFQATCENAGQLPRRSGLHDGKSGHAAQRIRDAVDLTFREFFGVDYRHGRGRLIARHGQAGCGDNSRGADPVSVGSLPALLPPVGMDETESCARVLMMEPNSRAQAAMAVWRRFRREREVGNLLGIGVVVSGFPGVGREPGHAQFAAISHQGLCCRRRKIQSRRFSKNPVRFAH